MRVSALSSLALVVALGSFAHGMTYTDGAAAATPAPEVLEAEEDLLGARQVTGQGIGATLGAQQMPAITTVYLPTQLGNTNTWLPFPYTQTFAAVPDQWPSPAQGVIGLGTLARRDAEPEPTPGPLDTGLAGRIRV